MHERPQPLTAAEEELTSRPTRRAWWLLLSMPDGSVLVSIVAGVLLAPVAISVGVAWFILGEALISLF